jgi:hypothetical protein
MSSLLRSCEINEYELFVEFDKSGVFCGVFRNWWRVRNHDFGIL